MPQAFVGRARSCCARFLHGFTLIELLVVIAIIAILIGVLLPALAKARIAGRQAIVLGRLHDMGIGNMAYMNDYRDKLPALLDYDEKPVLSLSILARVNAIPNVAFINPNTLDTVASAESADGRPVLADLSGAEIDVATSINPGNIAQVNFHCSFSYDNDAKPHGVWKPIVYMGDRADYATGKTFSPNWKGQGMCLLWTDSHGGFVKSQAAKEQGDPNIYHHNEYGGEGGAETRGGISVRPDSLDTHMRFFSEDEDDVLLPDGP
jgi:prepilin-type N-terminal cleavage/methylation domain-containing protein